MYSSGVSSLHLNHVFAIVEKFQQKYHMSCNVISKNYYYVHRSLIALKMFCSKLLFKVPFSVKYILYRLEYQLLRFLFSL